MDDLARSLREEARRSDERRVLVLAGSPSATRDAARDAVATAAIPPDETTVVGPAEFLDSEHLETVHAGDLLGRTRTAVVLDAHESFRPNALGASVGAVDGGGLLLLLTPPLDEWAGRPRPAGEAAERASGDDNDTRTGRHDEFDASLAVPPFGVDDVTGHFRRRVVETLREHPGIAIVTVGDGSGEPANVERDGLTDPAPRIERGRPEPPVRHTFPAIAYETCLTEDQVETVHAFETFREDGPRALVVEADRGRGKSSAAGLAAASLALEGNDVLVTAPQYRSAREVFARAEALLRSKDALVEIDDPNAPQLLATVDGTVRFELPAAAVELPDSPDVVIVDEAAALPVRVLERFLEAPGVAFTTTVHGYEGAGRGFSVRFRDRLDERDHERSESVMTTPIRYAPADPVESWVFRALLLDARPAVDPLVEDATPDTVEYRTLSPEELLGDEHLLREAFGLLVLAHYRTEPDDLARLLDAPNVTARALTHQGHVVSVLLLAREGDLPGDLRADMYAGSRVRGNMIPDVLTTQLRDADAGATVGQRVLRIATHPAVRSRGLGSCLLSETRNEFAGAVDWLGVGYGATPDLVSFWDGNGFDTVHLSTTRNDASGEHSAIMLDPCAPAGKSLATRHGEWFLNRVESALSDPLRDIDPDVARAALEAASETPKIDLSAWEWRIVAGVPSGATTFDTNPSPFRRLTMCYLVDPDDPTVLSDDEERVLVRKVLQAHEWEAVADEFEFVSTAECMRSVARSVERLTRLYGNEQTMEELDSR